MIEKNFIGVHWKIQFLGKGVGGSRKKQNIGRLPKKGVEAGRVDTPMHPMRSSHGRHV